MDVRAIIWTQSCPAWFKSLFQHDVNDGLKYSLNTCEWSISSFRTSLFRKYRHIHVLSMQSSAIFVQPLVQSVCICLGLGMNMSF